MSLAEKASARAEEQAKSRELKTLVIDVERLKGRFRWDERYDGLTIDGEFWGLSDYKHKFGRIPHDKVTEWPRTICAAWRWYGQKRVQFAAEWLDGPLPFAEAIWQALNAADIVVGHNANRFDRKHMNTLMRDHGLKPPKPYKVLDTLTIGRSQFGDESMTLDALCRRLGIPTKTDKYDHDVARAATDGDKAAQRRIKAYNEGDIVASEALYLKLLPWTKGHPHVAPVAGMDRTICPRCASEDVERDGTWSPAVKVYLAYRCNSCGGPFTTMYEGRGPSVRAL